MPEIRKASTAREGELRKFYEAAFPERAAFLSEHWEWLYRVGRFPGVEPLVLVENERVVGHAGAIPVMVSRLGVVAPAIWFVDFKILPEFQGKGLGKTLTAAWMEMCPDRITFCNERSMAVFRSLGWSERSDASARSQPFELAGPLRARYGLLGAAAGAVLAPAARLYLRARAYGAPELKVEPLLNSAGGLAERLDDPSAPTRLVRDSDWMRWRLLENPRMSEHRLASSGGVNAVFRLFKSLGRTRAHLLHVGPGPAAARAGLVKAFSRWALDQGVDDAWLATSDEALLSAAAPVLTRLHPLRFAWHSADAAVTAALAGALPTQGIDSDHDLMFP